MSKTKPSNFTPASPGLLSWGKTFTRSAVPAGAQRSSRLSMSLSVLSLLNHLELAFPILSLEFALPLPNYPIPVLKYRLQHFSFWLLKTSQHPHFFFLFCLFCFGFWYSLWSYIFETQMRLCISFAWNLSLLFQPLAMELIWNVGNGFLFHLSLSLSYVLASIIPENPGQCCDSCIYDPVISSTLKISITYSALFIHLFIQKITASSNS